MRAITGFITNLLAAVNGVDGRPPLQIGIYRAYHPSEEPYDAAEPPLGLDAWTVLPLRPATRFERDFDWAETLDAAMREPTLYVGGYAPMIRRLTDNGVLVADEDEKQIVVLITDGYLGDYADPVADDMRTAFEQVLQDLALQENTIVHFLQFACPGLADDSSYEEDQLHWTSFAGLDFLVRWLLPLSDETSTPGANGSISQAQAATVVQLLEHESFTPLLPFPPDVTNTSPGEGASSPDGASGWAWLREGELESELPPLPGNTATLRLNVVRSDRYSSFNAVLKRDGREYNSPNLKEGDFPGTFVGSSDDNLLAEILEARTRSCGAIDWRLEGDGQLAFYWWDSDLLNYSLDETKAKSARTTNNGPISVAIKVSDDGQKGYYDCYSVRATLRTADDSSVIMTQREWPLAEFDEFLEMPYTFEGYEFAPDHPGARLSVTVELLRHLSIPTGDSVVTARWERSIAATYQPQLITEADGSTVNCGGQGCATQIVFDFATNVHHGSHAPIPQLFALSSLKNEDEAGDEACEQHAAYAVSANGVLSVEDERDVEPQLLSGLEIERDEGQYPDGPQWRGYESGARRFVELSAFSDGVIETCLYQGVLLQWPENSQWPSVYCAFSISEERLACQEISVDQLHVTVQPDAPTD